MKTILEQLYKGELFPNEQIVPSDPDYRALTHEIGAERESLKKLLGSEDAERLEKLGLAYYAESNMSDYANFSYGIKLGARLMYEILAPDPASFL